MIHNIVKPKLLALVIPAALIIVVSVVYFFLWRPSDSAIQGTLSDVDILKKSATIMPSALQSLSTPVGITAEMSERFKQRVVTYTDAFDALEKSPAIQRNSSTKAIYEKHKTALFDYGQQLDSLSTSISAYGAILKACDAMVSILEVIDTKSRFDEESTACNEAITNADWSENRAFNEQFLNDYSQKAKKLLSVYGQYFTAADSNDSVKLKTAMATLDKEESSLYHPLYATIDYGIAHPSSSIFTELTRALSDQKNSFLR